MRKINIFFQKYIRPYLRNIYLNIVGKIRTIKPGIHIVNSHYVTTEQPNIKRDYEIFDNFLSYLNKKGKFITLEEATKRIIQNDIPSNEVLIVFTYDDGFEECYTVIAPLLEKYKTKGAFFINSNYIESSNKYQKEFNKRVNSYTKKPMTWVQIKDLHKRGHLIGSHNLDHSNFEGLNLKEIEYQLSKNKQILESKLNYNCDYFAWTYGKLHHFPIKAFEIANKYHKHIFSGTNYKNYFSFNGRVINRRHLESFWPKTHLKFFISKNKIYNTNYKN